MTDRQWKIRVRVLTGLFIFEVAQVTATLIWMGQR